MPISSFLFPLSSFRRWLLVVLLGASVLGGIGWGGWSAGAAWLERSPWSRLESVQVAGTARLSSLEIVSASGLKAGMNIMRLPLDRISAAVEKIPGVREARIVRKLPGRVLIRVEERRAVACLFRDRLWLVDEEGVLFPLIGAGEVVDVPVLTGDFDLGKNDPRELEAAIRMAVKLRDAYPTIYAHLGEVTIQSGRVGFRLKEGGARVLADDPTSPAALVKLEQFLLQKGRELPTRCEYIDLRYPAMVVTGTE